MSRSPKVTEYSTGVHAIPSKQVRKVCTDEQGRARRPGAVGRRALPFARDSNHFNFRLRPSDFRLTNVLEKFIRQLAGANRLSDEEVRAAVDQLADEKVPTETKADF